MRARSVVPSGEGSKSYATFEKVCEAIIAARLERNDLIVALGGGVIGDLAGFAASSVRRGLDFVQVPTTLLAQVDSSVGGQAAFFAWLEKNWPDVFAGGPAREHAIAVCCRGKASIVARDERETGERALLNLGHTFGHAIEAGCGFSDRLLHGEAVALGMALAFEFSARKGLIGAPEAARAAAHLAAVGLPTHLKAVPGGTPGADALMDLIAQDKKVRRGTLTFILVRDIGRAFVENNVDAAEVRAFLSDKLAER